ncbi:probable serine protease HtrA1 [Oppia nitens]|uniref:probable serine protease HtrA1 n=1 Tax=Oppia nitens TaxID=1686743 RepID=UPI0023DC406A|nr:probable serine protease HtrA1 [Oppia nitens]
MYHRLALNIQWKTIIQCTIPIMSTLTGSTIRLDQHRWSNNYQQFCQTRISGKGVVVGLRCAKMLTTAEHIQQLYTNYSNRVVKVLSKKMSNCGESYHLQETGIIVDSMDGLVLTNFYLVSDCPNVTIQLATAYYEKDIIIGKPNSLTPVSIMSGQVVYVDPQIDLALIRMTDYVRGSLRAMDLSQNVPNIGDEVILLGNADMFGTLQYGIVCSLPRRGELSRSWLINRQVTINEDIMFAYQSPTVINCCGGAPVIDLNGQVVGISLAFVESKINFATKATDAIAFIDKGRHFLANEYIAIKNQRQNRLKRPNSLGIILKGNVIRGFTYNVTDARNQLQLNDIILSINHIEYTGAVQLVDAMNNLIDGQSIELMVMRVTTAASGQSDVSEVTANIRPVVEYNWFYF